MLGFPRAALDRSMLSNLSAPRYCRSFTPSRSFHSLHAVQVQETRVDQAALAL